jgi:muramoyltetrapeptide carboxypeptidase LdcA involved in peptidoglycan recycling
MVQCPHRHAGKRRKLSRLIAAGQSASLSFAPSPSVLISPNPDGWTIASWEWADEKRNQKKRELQPCSGWRWLQGSGQHRGRLIGGCLEVVDWLRGTPVWPVPSMWRDSILFLEISEDRPSPTLVTYMLRSLAATGALNEIRGYSTAGLMVTKPAFRPMMTLCWAFLLS